LTGGSRFTVAALATLNFGGNVSLGFAASENRGTSTGPRGRDDHRRRHRDQLRDDHHDADKTGRRRSLNNYGTFSKTGGWGRRPSRDHEQRGVPLMGPTPQVTTTSGTLVLNSNSTSMHAATFSAAAARRSGSGRRIRGTIHVPDGTQFTGAATVEFNAVNVNVMQGNVVESFLGTTVKITGGGVVSTIWRAGSSTRAPPSLERGRSRTPWCGLRVRRLKGLAP